MPRRLSVLWSLVFLSLLYICDGASHIKYYDPLASTLGTLFTWEATVFQLVFRRPEFYLYIIWNLAVTTVCIFAVEQGVIEEFNWDAASIMQYVMSFFVTFYNDKCYERFSTLYPACCDFMEQTQNLVMEMNVSLPWRDLHYHRIAVTKYLLAVVHEYFMITTGGKLNGKAWEEFVKKGLLTREECKLLEQFPGGESTFVLTSWVLFIIRDALLQDCMWRRNPSGPRDWQPQQTVHIYNRHCSYVVGMQKACHKIGYTMANPIPFAYYHLSNVILVFNILLLATFTALYRNYFMVFPLAVALLVYMGLREISTSLADPFGKDCVDFPIPDFMRCSFDTTVSMLLAFMRSDVRENVLLRLNAVEDFKDSHLKRAFDPTLFSPDGDPTKGVATIVKWPAKGLFESAKPEQDLVHKFKYSFSSKEWVDEGPVIEMKSPLRERKKNALKGLIEEKKIHKVLDKELHVIETRYNEVLALMDKLIDAYPQLEDCHATINVREELIAPDEDSSSASSATDAATLAVMGMAASDGEEEPQVDTHRDSAAETFMG